MIVDVGAYVWKVGFAPLLQAVVQDRGFHSTFATKLPKRNHTTGTLSAWWIPIEELDNIANNSTQLSKQTQTVTYWTQPVDLPGPDRQYRRQSCPFLNGKKGKFDYNYNYFNYDFNPILVASPGGDRGRNRAKSGPTVHQATSVGRARKHQLRWTNWTQLETPFPRNCGRCSHNLSVDRLGICAEPHIICNFGYFDTQFAYLRNERRVYFDGIHYSWKADE